MTLRLNGATSGYTEIDAPAVAGNNAITLPGGNGSANQFLKNGATPGALGWSSMTENSGNVTINGSDCLLRFSTTSVALRTDGVSSYINNMNGFVGNGASGNGLLNITGQTGISLRYGSSGSAGTEAMQIDSAGRVGIGRAPISSSFLDVNGLVRVLSAGGSALEIGTGTASNQNALIDLVGDTTYGDYGFRMIRGATGANTNTELLHRGTGALSLNAQDAGIIVLATSGVERMRITSDGKLFFGHNVGAAGSTGMIAPLGYVGRSGTSGSFVNVFNVAWTGTVANLWIDASNFGAIQVSSDYRIKKNVQTQTAPAIERIKLLRPVTYELKDYENLFQEDGVQREGFIAHEVQEVIPSGAEGEKDEENRIQNLRLDAIVSVLTKALQEAVERIETLEAKVIALEAN